MVRHLVVTLLLGCVVQTASPLPVHGQAYGLMPAHELVNEFIKESEQPPAHHGMAFGAVFGELLELAYTPRTDTIIDLLFAVAADNTAQYAQSKAIRILGSSTKNENIRRTHDMTERVLLDLHAVVQNPRGRAALIDWYGELTDHSEGAQRLRDILESASTPRPLSEKAARVAFHMGPRGQAMLRSVDAARRVHDSFVRGLITYWVSTDFSEARIR